jgi:hypothetical protein
MLLPDVYRLAKGESNHTIGIIYSTPGVGGQDYHFEYDFKTGAYLGYHWTR